MESEKALLGFAALAQSTRLDVVRALVSCEPDGLRAGNLAERLSVPANTLSSHLNILSQAGLVRAERAGRAVTYRICLDQLRGLVLFLLQDCCGGRTDLCEPLLADLAACRA
ncbi:MAG: metalloregulator ArsR/SmtB family transcription factor [Alphaproteobacteria bacterium]|nr:metalloregulator ArsR/SmtB family transcription factor [Alphaproteobacteria bacterium]MBU2379117.1 metalloregulator ArsR/SmtB family transcription factor [Alphaproteobacteria bacterium]